MGETISRIVLKSQSLIELTEKEKFELQVEEE